MPNWTRNKIICTKEIAKKILTETDNGLELDFNKLIPMPESLDLTAGSIEHESIACYYHSLTKKEQRELEDLLDSRKSHFSGSYWDEYENNIKVLEDSSAMKDIKEKYSKSNDKIKEKFSSIEDLGKAYIDNIENYNYPQWYDWRCANWGTKWNVEDEVNVIQTDDDCEISFYTAWSAPYGIIKEYSKLCTDEEFSWDFENEDFDGHHHLTKNGNIISDYITEESDVSDDMEEVCI